MINYRIDGVLVNLLFYIFQLDRKTIIYYKLKFVRAPKLQI